MSHPNHELPQRDILRSQTSEEENQLNSRVSETVNTELLHTEAIVNTPFHLMSIEDKSHFITIGKYRISEKYNTKEEALKLLDQQPWELIFNLVLTLINVDKEK